MNFYLLSWKNLVHKPLTAGLNLLLFALGVGIIAVVMLLSEQLEQQMDRNQAGIGMVVGAKGSPLQLILCSIFHVDFPTGNIPFAQLNLLQKHPMVKQAIPQALGDSYQGFRIVGTTTAYPDLYAAELMDGQLWQADMEVTVGYKVAQTLHLTVGHVFEGQHGMLAAGEGHHEHPFKVAGIFKPTGTVLDQLIMTNLASIWEVHDHASVSDNGKEKEITSILVKFRSPMGAIQMPRFINETTNLQAASPAFEIARLYSMMGVGMEALHYLAYIILTVSGFSVFISLFNSLKERKYELAYLRVLGARPFQLLVMVLSEGMLLTVFGIGLGILFGHLSMGLLGVLLEGGYHYAFSGWYFSPSEIWLCLGACLIGGLASVIPAIGAFRTEVANTLAQG